MLQQKELDTKALVKVFTVVSLSSDFNKDITYDTDFLEVDLTEKY